MARKVKSDQKPDAEGVTTATPKKVEAETMEQLLSATGYNLKGLKKGDVVEGNVTKVTGREILVDIGGKSEGVVIDRELETYKDMLMSLKPGDSVVAQVIVTENDRGQSVLSLRRFIFEKRWNTLADHQKSGEPVDEVL